MNERAAPNGPAVPAQSAFRVLVVDDDPDMAAFLARLLKQEGMSADIAPTGEAAVMQAMTAMPDLILLDVMMPGMTGFEVCERLKGDETTALVPIVLVTSLEDSASRVRGIEAGADDFLSKPVKREELLARVKTLRRLHETRKELERRRLAAEIQRKEALRRTFERYVSPRVAERILAGSGERGELVRGGAQRMDVVALFADLRGFTALTETTEVAEVVEMLNEYFAILSEAAYHHDGTIFNMAGDSLLIGFNVPFAQADATLRAWNAAREMMQRFAPVSARWKLATGVATGVGIGICSGDVIVGNVGSPAYASYTIIGNPVNMASRLVQLAASNEVLMCGAFAERLRRALPGQTFEERGAVTLRGVSHAVQVFAARMEAAPT